MTTVLLTAIGGDISQGVAAVLRECFPDWRLLGTDSQHRHGGALFVDEVLLAPAAADGGYCEWLGSVVSSNAVDFCFPLSEPELLRIAQERERSRFSCSFIMPNARAVEVGSDKLSTSQFLAQAGIEAPWAIPIEEFGPRTSLPCILKARRGSGSKAVHVCSTAADVEYLGSRIVAPMLQQLLLPADQEVTCAVYRGSDGVTRVLQLLRRLTGGFTGWAQVIENPDVYAQCVAVAEALDLSGSINIQLRVTEDGPRIFEINPRFSSTALMRHRMGFSDVLWSLQDEMKETPVFVQPAPGTIAVRTHDAVLLPGPSSRGSAVQAGEPIR